MKLSLILTALMTAAPAFAVDTSTGLLLVKEGHSGFVPPEYAYSLKCQIYKDYTSIEKRTGAIQHDGHETIYTAAVPNAKAAIALAKLAAKGKIIETTGPTDGPTSSYVGVIEGTVVDSHVKLYINRSHIRHRNSVEKAVKALTEFADKNCAIDSSDE